MKVYLSQARKLRLNFPNFRDWESAMINQYGPGIKIKTKEIWNQTLINENASIKNSPIPPSYQDFGITENLFREIKGRILKSDEYKQKIVSRLSIALTTLFIIVGLTVLITIFILNNIYFKLKSERILIIISLIILFLISIHSNVEMSFQNFFHKIAAFFTNHKFKPIPKNELTLISEFENAVKIYEKALKDYNNKVKAYNDELKRKVKNFWYSLSGWEFETEFEKLLKRQGFVTHKTSGSADGGVDIFATKGSTRYAVQCKAHKKPTGPSIVRDLYGSMNHNNIKNGILVNLGGFTEGVFDFVRDKSIILLNIDDVIELHEGKKTLWKL